MTHKLIMRQDLLEDGFNTYAIRIESGIEVFMQFTQPVEYIVQSTGKIHPDGYNLIIKDHDGNHYLVRSIDFELEIN